MKRENPQFTVHGLDNCPAYLECIGLAKCLEAYAHEVGREEIESAGFNPNSGYVYLALDNGLQIASMLGREVEYIVTDFETGTEYFLRSYEDAIEHQESIINNQ